jgi:phospholipid transport system substrate-binding protein
VPTKRQIFEAFEHKLAQFRRQVEGETDETKRKALEELLVRERAKRKTCYPMNRNLRAERETRAIAATVRDFCMVGARALGPYCFAGVAGLLWQVPAAHADATLAETFVQQSVDKEFAILKDASLAQQERETRSRALLRSIIDIKRVAMFALGPYARDASDKQIGDFVNAFSDYFLNMFHSDLDQSSGRGTIAVTGATARGADDVIVTASVAGADAQSPTGMPMNLSFRVRKNAAGNEVIVDVLVGAISMAVTQRDEFSSYLQQHGGSIDQLSAELEKRAAAK